MTELSPTASLPQRIACPHLGQPNAPHLSLGRPSDEHCCFAVELSGEAISHRHQAQRCLVPEWSRCYKLEPGFVSAAAIAAPLDTAPRAALPLLIGPHEPVALQATLSAGAAATPLPEPSLPVPAPVPAPGWQIPALWTMVVIPTMLLLLAGGLIMGLTASEEQQTARTLLSTPAVAEGAAARFQRTRAATPRPRTFATFAPITEEPDPGVLPMAPMLPVRAAQPTLPPDVIPPPPPPVGIANWPSQPATGTPDRIWSPRIGMDAEVVSVGSYIREIQGQPIRFYDVAEYAAGWHQNSSLPGYQGNVVVAGHHNIAGRVFEHLVELEPGDMVYLEAQGRTYPYLVALKQVLPETNVSEAQRAENARWIAPTTDERLTLVTCWPATGNSHRVIVVAVPAR